MIKNNNLEATLKIDNNNLENCLNLSDQFDNSIDTTNFIPINSNLLAKIINKSQQNLTSHNKGHINHSKGGGGHSKLYYD